MADTEFEVLIGAKLKDADLQNIRKQLGDLKKELNDNTDIKMGIDTKSISGDIKEIKSSLSKLDNIDIGIGKSLGSDISKMVGQVDGLGKHLKEMRASIGSVGKNSQMKPMLDTLNDISAALTKISNNLKTVQNSANAAGTAIDKSMSGVGSGSRSENDAVDILEKRTDEIVKALREYYKAESDIKSAEDAIARLVSDATGGDQKKAAKALDRYDDGGFATTAKKRMTSYKLLLNDLEKYASSMNISGVTDIFKGWEESANDVVNSTKQISNASDNTSASVKEMGAAFNLVENIDLSGVIEKLDKIVVGLSKVTSAIKSLPDNVKIEVPSDSIETASESAKKLSVIIESFGEGSGLNDFITIIKNIGIAIDGLATDVKTIATMDFNIGATGLSNFTSNINEAGDAAERNRRKISATLEDLEAMKNVKTEIVGDNANSVGIRSTAKQLGKLIYSQSPNATDTPTDEDIKKALSMYFAKSRYKDRDGSKVVASSLWGVINDTSDGGVAYGEWNGQRVNQTEAARRLIQSVAEVEKKKKEKERLDVSGIDVSWMSNAANAATQDAKDIDLAGKQVETTMSEVQAALGKPITINLNGVSNQLETIISKLEQVADAIRGLSSAAGTIGNVSSTLDDASNAAKSMAESSEEAGNAVKQMSADDIKKRALANAEAFKSGVSRDELLYGSTPLLSSSSAISSSHILSRQAVDGSDKIKGVAEAEKRLDEWHGFLGNLPDLAPTADNVRTLFYNLNNLDSDIEKLNKDSSKNAIATASRHYNEYAEEFERLYPEYLAATEEESARLWGKVGEAKKESDSDPNNEKKKNAYEKANKEAEDFDKAARQLQSHMKQTLIEGRRRLEMIDADFKDTQNRKDVDKAVKAYIDSEKEIGDYQRKLLDTTEGSDDWSTYTARIAEAEENRQRALSKIVEMGEKGYQMSEEQYNKISEEALKQDRLTADKESKVSTKEDANLEKDMAKARAEAEKEAAKSSADAQKDAQKAAQVEIDKIHKDIIDSERQLGDSARNLAKAEQGTADWDNAVEEYEAAQQRNREAVSRLVDLNERGADFTKEQYDSWNKTIEDQYRLTDRATAKVETAETKKADAAAKKAAAKAEADALKETKDYIQQYKNLMTEKAGYEKKLKSASSETEASGLRDAIDRVNKEMGDVRVKIKIDDDDIEESIPEIKAHKEKLERGEIVIDAKVEADRINGDFNKLMSTIKRLNDAEVRLAGMSEFDDGFEDAQRAVSELRVEVNKLEGELGGGSGRISLFNKGDLNDEQFKQYCNTVRQGAADVQDAADKMVKAHREMAQSAADSLGANGLSTTRLKSLNRDISNISNPSENANNAVAGYAKAYHNLEEALERYNNAVSEYGANSNQAIAAAHAMANAQDDLEKAYKDATNAIKQNKDVSRDAEANERFLLNQQKILTSMDAWEKKNDRVMNGNSQKAKELAEEFVTLRRRIEECDNAADLAKLNTELSTFKNKVKVAGLEGESAFTKLKNKFQEYASYAAASMGIMEIIQGLQQMAQEVIEVDTAMTGLYRVTELTADQYDELYDKMVSSAKEYGRTLTDTINATSDWVKAGFDDTDLALELAEITAMYQNVSDLDYDTAAENLITAYNGFKPYFTDAEQFGNDVAGSVMHITDVLNQLDNEFSVTSAGLGESMTRSASALEMAGNTFEESVAMAGAITEVTQDPEKAGSALKILSLRLRGMKGALQEMGEEVDDNVENISKMQGQILNMTHGDVNIFNDDGSFKSTYKIMDEIAEVWEDLSSIEKADLLETIAGKNRANEVSALISAWGQAEDMKESALNAAGSAAEENAKKVESLEGRLNALTATWQAFANTVMESNFLKGLISTATSFLDVITQIIDKFGTLPTLIGLAFGAVKFTSFKDILPIQIVKDEATDLAKGLEFTFGKTVKNIASSMRTNTGPFSFGDTLSNAISDMDLIERYSSALRNGEGVDQALRDIQNGASESAQRYAQTMTTVTEAQRSSADASADCIQYMRKEDVARQAQSKKLADVNNLLNGYNDEAKRAGMSQQEYAEQCGKSNSVLGSYLRGLDGAKASMTGYVGSLISATAKTVLLEAASLALNAALTMGVSALISLGISAISKMITAADDLAKKIEEVTASYKSQHDELTKNKSDFEELAESYAKLSKGVDTDTGKNIGLTTSEYKEYQDVVNQIADMAPSLVAGYDSQGNAILNCASDVDSLTKAYNDLIIAENNALLNGDGEDYNGISDISDDLDNNYDDMADSGIWGDKLTMLGAGQLEKILNSSEIDEDVVAKYAGNMTTQIGTSLKDALEEKGLELEGVEMPAWYSSRDTWENFIAEACKQHPAVAQEIIDSMDAEMDAAVQEMRTAIGAHMENAFLNGDYSNIDSEMHAIAESIVGGLDSKLIMRLNESGGEDAVTNYVDNILKSINNLTETESEVLKGSFDLSSKFESGELSYGEYRAQLENAVKSIEAMGFDKEVESQLKLSLNVDEVNENYEAIKNRLTSDKFDIQMSTEEAEDFLSGLSSSEYSILMSMDLSNVSVDELESLVKDAAKLAEATSYTIDITAETEGIEALNTALAESRSATGLTIESMEALEGRYRGLNSYDAATLFQETANGISLNADALRKCESEYNKLQLDETTNSLETMKGEYDRLTEAIMNETDATKKSQLVNEREDIRSKITDLAELATMYEGLTSSYNEWQNAESSGNDRDMYTTVHSAMEGVDKELELGWIDDGTMEYFQLIWGEDKWDGAGKSIEDYRKKWNTLDDTIAGTSYSIQDFFKTNEDGELTSEGIFNFFDAVGEKQKELGEDWIKYDDDGNIDSFNFGVDGDKAIADALGISEEMVQIFLRAAEDAGFVVNFDGTYTQLANLQNEAMAANDKLKEIGKTDYTFDFNSTSLTDLNEQLGKAKEILKDESFWNADGTFNFDAEGATEAMQIVSTLQATIDNLDNKYIGLTVEDEAFEEPLEKAQDYESKVATLNQLELNPQANADEIDALKDDIDDIIGYFAELDDKTKEKLGIPVELEGDNLDKKIEEMLGDGTLKIPTVLDLQTNMNENIEDLVKLSLYNSGMLTEDEKLEIEQEFKLKYIESDDDDPDETVKQTAEGVKEKLQEEAGQDPIVIDQEFEINIKTPEEKLEELNKLTDGLGDEKKKVVVDFVSDNADEFWKLSEEERQVVVKYVSEGMNFDALTEEEQEVIVKLIGDDSELEGWTPEQKEAMVKYIVDGGDVEGWTPEQKKAWAQYLVDHGDIDGWTPEQKKAFAEYIVNGGNVDNWTPEDKEAFAKYIADGGNPAAYQPPPKTGTATYNPDDTPIVVWSPPLKTGGEAEYSPFISSAYTLPTLFGGIAKYTPQISGGSPADGTANANGAAFAQGTFGRAFKQGDWGVKGSGVALGGELGQELVVRNGRFFTIGDDGAEFFQYKKNDIIFNAGQTEQLLKQGKITNGRTRGRALVSGTAFAGGSFPSTGLAFSNGTGADNPWSDNSSSTSSSSKSSKSSPSSSSSSSSDDAEEFKEKLDWIEIAIDRIERAISKLDLTASSVFKKWSTRNSALAKQIAKVGEEIDLQERGAARYLQEANSVGLSSEYVRKVQNGEIDIEKITDEDLKEKIDEYQQWLI